MMDSPVSLGSTSLRVSPMGLGAWQWGDRTTWSYGSSHGEDDVRSGFHASLEGGINFIDTAELYGIGLSERLLGKFLKELGSDPAQPLEVNELVIASKYFPMPYRLTKGSLRRALKGSLRRLGLERLDLYQIHFPFPPVSIETWMDALADAHADGLVRAVGVSNYNIEQMRRAHQALARRNVPLASNQVPYHLLDRAVERNGLLAACVELNVTLIAYSPLAQGALTGKYTPDQPLTGIRALRYPRLMLEQIQPLVRAMREIGQAHDGKTPAQVALNWLICKGTIPIPGAKNARQAQENAGALGWRLLDFEVARLDELSASVGRPAAAKK